MEVEILLALLATVNRSVEAIKRIIVPLNLGVEVDRLVAFVAQIVFGLFAAIGAGANILEGTVAAPLLGMVATGLTLSMGAEGIYFATDLVKRLRYKREVNPNAEPVIEDTAPTEPVIYRGPAG